MRVKNIIFGILVHVLVRLIFIRNIIGDSVVTRYEIIDAVAKSYEYQQTTPINLNEKRQPVKCEISIFYLPFY